VLFAFDSIPAVFAVTRDPFLVFTSNIFAILGLRSLYFALAAVLNRLRYLRTSLVCVLLFVGGKILVSHHYSIPTLVSLAVILAILLIGVAASLILPEAPHSSRLRMKPSDAHRPEELERRGDGEAPTVLREDGP